MAEREVCMIRNDYEKSVLVKQIIQRLNPLYILTLNTCSSMSMESLNRHLSLLSAIVNKDKLKLKKKWYLQKDKRVKLFCFNEISKGGHIHSNCFLDCLYNTTCCVTCPSGTNGISIITTRNIHQLKFLLASSKLL